MADKMQDFQSQIKLEPIRHYAQTYGMNTPLPKTQAEFVAKLYEFGFRLNGGMEEMLNKMTALTADLDSFINKPIIYPGRMEDLKNARSSANPD